MHVENSVCDVAATLRPLEFVRRYDLAVAARNPAVFVKKVIAECCTAAVRLM